MLAAEAIDAIRRAGCRSQWIGSQLIVSNIPDWKTLLLVREWSKELAMIGMVSDVFKTPLKRIKYDPGKSNKCSFCINLYVNECKLHRLEKPRFRLPEGGKGCDMWKENKHIYF